MKKIFVMGSLNTDVSFEVDSLPKIGETVYSRSFLVNAGGKGANQAVAAAKQGANTIMLGAVGNDQFGKELFAELVKNGVDADRVIVKDCATGIAGVLLHNGNNRIIVHPGANGMYDFNDFRGVLEREAREGDVFIAQLETRFETVLEGLKLAKKLGMYVILNPAPAFVKAREALKYCDVVVVNETETEILVGEYPGVGSDYRRIGDKFRAYGVNCVVVTCGKDGSVLINGGVKTIAAEDVEVVDTTAAGDAYIGAMAAELAKGKPLSDALEYASAASVLTVTESGAQRSIPRYAEVIDFMKKHKK